MTGIATWRAAFLAAPLALVLSACTDLTAVRDWSETSMEAAQFTEIVGTYADTPSRLAFYDQGAQASWQAQSGVRQEQAEALELQLSFVAEYMAALAALSADGVTQFDDDVDGLTGALGRTGQVSEGTLGAAGRLLTTVANAAAGLWRAGEVEDLIEEANQPLQNLLRSELRTIVDKDFRRDLDVEAGILDRHFKDLLRVGGGSDAANAALNEWYVLRKNENARRMAAIDSYLVVLDKISEGHQKLYNNRNDLDAVRLAKDLFKLAKDIRKNVKDIVKA